MTSSDLWDEETAARYDAVCAEDFTPAETDATLNVLAGLAGPGRALEFAIGTGRIGIPLALRGVPVAGIELSEPMARQLRRKDPDGLVPVTIGDMATTRVDGDFSLVYLIYNTIANLRTQTEQVACFRNAARHLAPGGRFLIELWIPPIRRMPPGQRAVPFDVTDRHLGMDTYDLVTQQGTSHHYTHEADGSIRYGTTNFRYIWPAECDLMGQLAGLEFESRVADWDGSDFTADSPSHISVWRRPT